MKTCPVCAIELEDTYLFCPDDGSSLGDPAGDELAVVSRNIEPSSNGESSDETPGAVVLYCPTCAAEYPLTFSACPVHGLQLTRHKIPRGSNQQANPGASIEDDNQQASAEARLKQRETKRSNRLTSLDLERPSIESSRLVTVAAARDGGIEFDRPQPAAVETSDEREAELDDSDGRGISAPLNGNREFDGREIFSDAHEQGSDHRGFRVAAIATVILLTVLGLGALYSLFSHLSRRSSPSSSRVASQTEAAQPLAFVATPQEAQDYKESQPAPATSSPPDRQTEPRVERKPVDAPASPSAQRSAHDTAIPQPAKQPLTAPAAVPARMTKVSNPPLPALPRGNSGGFDSRLVRVRSRKTPSGFRYDLTFNMQEQAGRSAQWQRLLINSRSASGINHTEAIPFAHRLGATGALTFTVSVEMAGRSESDWQGRVVCTMLGWDNSGAPLQASFGANVTP